MRWKIHGERPIHENNWVNLWLTDIETPDGNRWEHHVAKLRHSAVAAVVDERREVLMMWRHRFITDAWARELPMGLVPGRRAPRPAQRRAVASGKRRPVRAPGELGDLIDTILSPAPGDRPTVEEARGALCQVCSVSCRSPGAFLDGRRTRNPLIRSQMTDDP
ncbi:hypothetical protein [Streptomyces parvus]|uniref:hypothetical protein n=1 Tax=Streptomyces parvus TaxID=66428 RepID=UPI0033FA3722